MNEDREVKALIDRVLDGDTMAFASIVDQWQGPLINLAYRFCRDHGKAEDMAQEAFLRAFRGLGSWRRDAAFSTWLFALAMNVYRDEMRRFKPELVPIEENVAETGSAEDAVISTDGHKMVHTALQSLPPLKFPWIRLLPGILAAIVAIAATLWHGFVVFSDPATIALLNDQILQLAGLAAAAGIQWIVLAVALTIFSITFSSSLVTGATWRSR